MARPFKNDKKISVGVRLPPWLNSWLRSQNISKSALIEEAIIYNYSITDEIVHLHEKLAEEERLKKCK